MPAKNSDKLETKCFTLGSDDTQLIENVKKEEGLRSDSAAVRRLIQDGAKYRELMQQAQVAMAKKLAK